MFKPQVYIGYDPREESAYDVMKYSVKKYCSSADVHGLVQSDLRRQNLYTRSQDDAATQFSLTRFLVPKLMDYKGWAAFFDCDMCLTTSVAELFELADPNFAVQVVKHMHEPWTSIKMDSQKQYKYPKKNWSSSMLFNCSHVKNKNLTPEVISSVQPRFLHRFEWLDESDVGELPLTWNFLESYYKMPLDGTIPKNIHWTEGGPWFDNYKLVDFANVWNDMYNEMKENRDY